MAAGRLMVREPGAGAATLRSPPFVTPARLAAFRRHDSPVRRASAGTVAASIVQQAMLIVSGALTARILGPTDRGHAALVVLIPSVLAVAGSLGLSSAIRHAIAQNTTNARCALRALRSDITAQVLALTLCHAVITLVWILPSLPESARPAAWISLCTIPAVFLLDYTRAVLQGHMRFTAFSVVQVTPQIIYAAGVSVLYTIDKGSINSVVLLGTVAALFTGLISWVLAAPYLRASEIGSPPTRRNLRRYARRTYLGQVAPIESFRLDQLVVGAMMSPAVLGFYGVATAFSNLSRFLGSSIGYVLAPHIAALPPARRRRSLLRGLGFTAALCGGITLVLMAAAHLLVPLLFGEPFRPAIPLAQILLIAGFFLGLRRAALAGLQGLGHPEIGSYAELVALAIFALLLPLAVSLDDGLGIALLFLTSAVVAMASILFFLMLSRRATNGGSTR